MSLPRNFIRSENWTSKEGDFIRWGGVFLPRFAHHIFLCRASGGGVLYLLAKVGPPNRGGRGFYLGWGTLYWETQFFLVFILKKDRTRRNRGFIPGLRGGSDQHHSATLQQKHKQKYKNNELRKPPEEARVGPHPNNHLLSTRHINNLETRDCCSPKWCLQA